MVILATSLRQALCVQSSGTCTGAGDQSEQSYWRVHRVSSGVCMFESVKTARMYLRIKDGRCNGTVSISLIPACKCLARLSVRAMMTTALSVLILTTTYRYIGDWILHVTYSLCLVFQ